MKSRGILRLVFGAAISLSLSACFFDSDSDADSVVQGTVLSGDTPIEQAAITLYRAAHMGTATLLARTETSADGAFSLAYQSNGQADEVIYLLTEYGRFGDSLKPVPRQYRLATVIHAPGEQENIVINDRTTVATAFSLAQFVDSHGVAGPVPGLPMAARMVPNLVNLETGAAGATVTNDANEPGSQFSTLKTLNEMANLVASCGADESVCESFMQLALPLAGSSPDNTFQAVVNMARNPWRDPVPLFDLVQADTYQQDLGTTPPSAWTLALKFKGDPVALAGPGNMSFDTDGFMWIANNLVTDETYVLPDCGSQLVFKMDPATGSVETFGGGGVVGAGYGINIAANSGDIWVGNFGFKGSTCPGTLANNSVSQFSPQGLALSPDATVFDFFGNPQNGGWTNGGVGWPQGTVTNTDGDIWIANCNGATTPGGQVDVTVYRQGDPDDFMAITDPALVKSFDVAFDTDGRAWVSGTNSDNILAFDANGNRLVVLDLGTDAKPMGVASDSRGNVWVSLSGQIELPCPDAPGKLLTGTTGVALVNIGGIQRNTRQETITSGAANPPGGMTIAWGIAVDGNDNVWVANFTRGGLTSLCGANIAACPPGFNAGDALSPDVTGYHSDLLDRNTAVEIDASGNVWLANNWKDIPLQTDPAGDSMVVYLGLAAPISTPLIGTPQQP